MAHSIAARLDWKFERCLLFECRDCRSAICHPNSLCLTTKTITIILSGFYRSTRTNNSLAQCVIIAMVSGYRTNRVCLAFSFSSIFIRVASLFVLSSAIYYENTIYNNNLSALIARCAVPTYPTCYTDDMCETLYRSFVRPKSERLRRETGCVAFGTYWRDREVRMCHISIHPTRRRWRRRKICRKIRSCAPIKRLRTQRESTSISSLSRCCSLYGDDGGSENDEDSVGGGGGIAFVYILYLINSRLSLFFYYYFFCGLLVLFLLLLYYCLHSSARRRCSFAHSFAWQRCSHMLTHTRGLRIWCACVICIPSPHGTMWIWYAGHIKKNNELTSCRATRHIYCGFVHLFVVVAVSFRLTLFHRICIGVYLFT